MSRWCYGYHGLTILSDLEVPEWSFCALPLSGDACDVRISLSSQEAEQLAGDYTFSARNIARFTIRSGREIIVVPLPGACDRKIRLFLTGSAWGALIYQRGGLLIHASAVAVEGGAVAFCAKSGSGKSTLAALLSRQGFPLIGDDLCCLSIAPGQPPALYPSIPRLKLWDDAIHQLGWGAVDKEEDQFRIGKYLYRTGDGNASASRPLRGLYVLAWGAAGIASLSGFNAITRLLAAATWRGDLLMQAGRPEEYFVRLSGLAREVKCWEFRRPRDITQLPENTRLLTRHMSAPRE